MKKSHLLTLVATALFLALMGASFWDVLWGEESSPPAATTVEESPPPAATIAEESPPPAATTTAEESPPPAATTTAEESPPPAATPSAGLRASTAEAAIPPVLGGLSLVETVTGDEGLAQVNRMHGKDVGLVRGYIAQYAGNGARATLWAGWAESEAAAQALTDRMTARIGPDHPVFQDLQVLTFGQRTVYTVAGEGQQHYYFRSGAAVVWVAVDGAAAQAVVHDTLKLFP